MSNQTEARLTRQPVFLFVVATAMATTVATLAATAMVKAEVPQSSVVCECAAPVAAVPAQKTAPIAEVPVQKTAPIAEVSAPVQLAPVVPSEPTIAVTPVVPRVRQANATVNGTIDKGVIRRIVRAHINEVRYCYNQGLEQDPELAGRVAVQFRIDAEGTVDKATVASSDLGSDRVGNCITGAVQRWKFPKTSDGHSAVVTYPFVLQPE